MRKYAVIAIALLVILSLSVVGEDPPDTIPGIKANVELAPDTLHFIVSGSSLVIEERGRGRYTITCHAALYIEGFVKYYQTLIEMGTEAEFEPIPAEDNPTEINYSEDTKELNIMAKFSGEAVSEQIKEYIKLKDMELPADITVKVTGKLALVGGQVLFEGYDIIHVKERAKGIK